MDGANKVNANDLTILTDSLHQSGGFWDSLLPHTPPITGLKVCLAVPTAMGVIAAARLAESTDLMIFIAYQYLPRLLVSSSVV